MDIQLCPSMGVARDRLHAIWNMLPDYDTQEVRDQVALSLVDGEGRRLWAEAHPSWSVDAQVWGDLFS